ncbi:MAG: sulfotransferase family protein [Flavobacteriales bacterium]|nr:sulfotransferase family protein [Flavobacteriales bacterium]
MNKIICLWSCPRNVSTSLMYSFGNRKDTAIFDEPLYAHYLIKNGLNHPGRDETLKTQENNGEKVIQDIILKPIAKINFHKLMTHFLIDLDLDFLNKVTNVLFIRNPKNIINSYHKVIPFPSIDDIGIKKQYDLFNHLKKNGKEAIVIDAKELLKNPEAILTTLCAKINIPFDRDMLSWEKGPKKEDGSWAKYWYTDTHNSTKFNQYIEKEIILTGRNIKLAQECEQYYDFLYSKSIKAKKPLTR